MSEAKDHEIMTHHHLEFKQSAIELQEQRLANNRCAVVTLIYKGNEASGTFAVGAQNLGYSLLRHRTKMKMVALVTELVSEEDRQLLVHSGWSIKPVHTIKNPNHEFQSRLDFIYTKLQIFNLVEYDRVVYLDADTQVFDNIDQLCSCNGRYCAVVRNTFFNAGVMVVQPSAELYADIERSVPTIHSYTGGDQGFLNSYFWNPERCPFYDPQLDLPTFTEGDVPYASCYRIPALYNGDVAMQVARGDHWLLDAKEEHQQPLIIHWTFAILKPWEWWSYLVVKEHWKWWEVYDAFSGTTSYRYSHFFFIMLPLICFWVYIAQRNFLLPALAKIAPSSCAPGLVFSSNMFRFAFGELMNTISFFAAFWYSNLIFIQPWANLIIFLTTYWTLFDLLCLQLANFVFYTINITVFPDPSLPASSSPSIPLSNIPIALPSAVWTQRISLWLSSALMFSFAMTAVVTLIPRTIIAIIWLVLFMVFSYLNYLSVSYSHFNPKQ